MLPPRPVEGRWLERHPRSSGDQSEESPRSRRIPAWFSHTQKFTKIPMILLRFALLVSAICGTSAQILAPFGPFPPLPPPPFFTVFVFPPVSLQARAGGGLRASIPDDCGIESFEFESKQNATGEWKGGNVTSKTEGNWIFEDPTVLLAPGDLLMYRCRIKQRGSYISNPDAEWIVPGLVNDYNPPLPAKNPEECPEEPSTTKPDEKKEETTPSPDEAEDEPTENPDDPDSTDKPEKKKSDKPDKKKSEKPEKKKPEGPKPGECPAPPPRPGETREEILERKLWQVQCDMLQLAERSFRINEALSNELTELKKLNYVVVTRIQRLESLVRNLNRPVPYPAVFPFN